MFSNCILRIWLPAIGEAHFVDWFIIFGYLVVGYSSFRVFRSLDINGTRIDKLYWLVIAIMMVLLAFNKHFDFHYLIAVTAKCIAWSEGWYEQRKLLQLWLIGGILVLGVVALIVLLTYFGRKGRRYYLSIFGAGILLSFFLLRTNSLHGVDEFFFVHVMGVRTIWILEFGGQALILWNAVLLLRSGSRSRMLGSAS